MANQHTPGPWRVYGAGRSVIQGNTMQVVCRMPGEWDNPRHIEDSQLIAAAPDLLAACEALITQYDAPGGPAITEQIKSVRTAIAKACGEVA